MVSLCTSNEDIYNIKQLIKARSKHSFIAKHIEEPSIDIEKILILYHLYDHLNIPVTEKQQYMATIMLIQIALDTHENVPTETSSKRTDLEKKLSVLAGDYYSGLYYLFLSELEDIEMINVLAAAIKQINEYKMRLYYEEVDSIDDFKLVVKQIESLLYTKTATYLNEPLIKPIIEEWLLISRLIKERDLILQEKDSLFKQFINELQATNRYQTIIDQIDGEITQTAHTLDNLLNNMPLHLIDLKSSMADYLMKKVYKIKGASMVEEG